MTSALVVLKPGKRDVEVTAATRGEWQPDLQSAERTRRMFGELGFEIGPLVGLSFSIDGPRELFERVFPDFDAKEGTGEPFDLSRVPGDEALEAVLNEPPPAFGPGNP